MFCLPFVHHTTQIVSVSADKTVGVWDANAGTRIRKCTAHTACVNSVAMAGAKGCHLFLTGSDDASARLWDMRSRRVCQELSHKYQVRFY